jgi:very-short-patch-repair endonuclease
MSKFEDDMFVYLKLMFPNYRIVKQFYVNVENRKYFFDFYIKELNVLIECHGEQHLKFVKHFHGDMVGFNRHKARDATKEAYAFENNYTLVKFFYNEAEKIKPTYVKNKIYTTILCK